MKKPAYQVVREQMFAGFQTGITAMRAGKVDNEFLRDAKAIHANTTYSDIPDSLRKALEDATEATFRKLLAEGYVIEPRA